MNTVPMHSLSGQPREPVIRVIVPKPKMGGKCFLLNDKGLYVLEEGPGTFITAAVTHAGAGSLEIIDGIPDENGFFPDYQEPDPLDDDPEVIEEWGKRNGRAFYSATPVVMGSWMLNAGFHNGLTIRAEGGHGSVPAIASIVWMPFVGVVRA